MELDENSPYRMDLLVALFVGKSQLTEHAEQSTVEYEIYMIYVRVNVVGFNMNFADATAHIQIIHP